MEAKKGLLLHDIHKVASTAHRMGAPLIHGDTFQIWRKNVRGNQIVHKFRIEFGVPIHIESHICGDHSTDGILAGVGTILKPA